ncbi:DUF4236 domain-containing protein [Bifidobacterium sp. 64T4]|uniref:DUF4236 domain-containing protein n=1 Tax=Bifidobacterium pongonis TaxID=2834432 RepID=UPI001C569A98|nr:DUF4236 domain-containing protein [Bifidobacterium pongonis]MBW3095011.1 DUF4236 domain-containing protein [Bifidobacterium pongonis]
MGFRVRKSISLGKGVRINLGKDGVSSVSFGKRGAPHVTVGKRGTYVGASIPGTGISYSHKISDNKHAKTSSSGSSAKSHGKHSAEPMYAVTSEEQIPIVPTSETYRGSHQTNASAASEPSSSTGPSNGGAGKPPVNTSQGGRTSSGKQPGKWKRRITLVIVALIAFCIGSITVDPTASTQYHDLQLQLTEQQRQNDTLKKQINDLDQQLEDIQNLKNQLDQQKTEQDKRQQEQDERQSQLDAREKNIAQREEAKKQAQEQAVQAAQKAQAEQQAQVEAQAQAQAQAAQQAQAQAQQAQPQAPQQNQAVSSGLAHGGAFCSPAGATAQSDRSSSILTCRTASDGRLRWMR